MLPGLKRVPSSDEISFFLLWPAVCYHLLAPKMELKKEGRELDVDQFKLLHGCVCICNSQVPARVRVILAMSIISP